MLKNEYLVAKIGLDTAENEPLQVWGVIQFNIHFTPYSGPRGLPLPSYMELAQAAVGIAAYQSYVLG